MLLMVVQNCNILTFKVNFLCQKLSESFQYFFFEEHHFRRISFFVFWHFLKNSIFKALYSLKWCPIFDDLEVVWSNWYQRNIGAIFTHWYMPSLCYKIIVNCHNLGHPTVQFLLHSLLDTRAESYQSIFNVVFFRPYRLCFTVLYCKVNSQIKSKS